MTLKDLVLSTRIIEELFNLNKKVTTSDIAKKMFTINNTKELIESDMLVRRQIDKLVKENLLLRYKLDKNKRTKYGYFVNTESIKVEFNKNIDCSTVIFLEINGFTFFMGYL